MFTACSSKTETQSYVDMRLQELQDRINAEKMKPNPDKTQIEKDESLLQVKRNENSLYNKNSKLLSERMDGHTKLYSLKGKYKVMVIPVEFSNVKMNRPEFFKPDGSGKVPAQEYLFGKGFGTMNTYYRHASMGTLDVTGEVTPVVQVDGSLESYGEAVEGNSDVNARGLVRDALVKLMKIKKDSTWWESFDNWDLQDYDQDNIFAESDGFIDAVILVYAGKDQASCQRTFDPNGTRPASANVPPGPKQASSVECFNRIWPHRWSLMIDPKDPLFETKGPIVEGMQRPSFNGLKITDRLFALDYNMQSEFSERSTFMHEFGHSLTLPDIYASGGENSTGSWELMSQNAPLEAQELSSFSKLSLGWLQPKIVSQGNTTSAYLGAYNFVTESQRNPYADYSGPGEDTEQIGNDTHRYSIVSTVPGSGEPVYRSVVALTNPTDELVTVIPANPLSGKYAAYSGHFDSGSKALTIKLSVPQTGDATASFDIIWGIETDSNFDSASPDIKMTGDFDIGEIYVNGVLKETLRMWSGDTNLDTLVDENKTCEVDRVKELRIKRIAGAITEAELKEFSTKLALCRQAVWVNRSYDLSAFRGKDVTIEIKYTTDPGYNEIGIVVDNIKFAGQTTDFESGASALLTEWKILEDGKEHVFHNQFYLMEYRVPGEKFETEGKTLSYNMDNNIGMPTQSMFLSPDQVGSSSALDRVRFVKMDYQSGLVVWYFNSKYSRNQNTPEDYEGHGYLLVVNSKVKEMPLPGTLGNADLFDTDGNYLSDKIVNEKLKDQSDELTCMLYTRYATYINGESPSCTGYAWLDALQGVSWDGALLRYRREYINDIYPFDREQFAAIDIPYRNNATIRTGMSAFRPKDAGDMAPLSVYKIKDNKVVPDEELTKTAVKYAPVSSFSDADNKWSSLERFQADSAVVEKHGFGFKVVSPDYRIIQKYTPSVDGDANDNYHRRPRVKVLFNWN